MKKDLWMRRRDGYTMVEVLIATFLFALLFLVASNLFQRTQEYFLRGRMRLQLTSESRSCLDTIMNQLRQGRANTVRIDSVSAVPYSRISFRLLEKNQLCAIRLENSRVLMQIDGGRDRVLAENVHSLMFTGDSTDPAVIQVTLHFAKRIGANYTERVLIPNHAVRMLAR